MTDAHAGLVNDVALKQGMLAISSKARSNYPQFVVAGHICHLCAVPLSVVRLAAQLAFGWERREGDSYPTEAGGALPGDVVANGLVPMGGFVCDFEDGSASFAARGMRVPHSKKKPSGGKDNFTMKTISLFFDGLSGWSRAHNVLAPQDDPE